MQQCWLRGVITTHIWVSADLLDHILIEVTGVSEQAAGNVVGVLEAVEDVIDHWRLRSLLEIVLGGLGGLVEVLDPAVVLGGEVGGDVLLELDHVAAGDLLRVGGGEDGGGVIVNGLVEQHGRGGGQQWQR